MADERTDDQTASGGVFDDDRLLACALGVEEDPELLAAVATDAALAARLAAMRADVAGVARQIGLAVPAPDEEYTDLSDARWAGLTPYLAAPKPAASRGRASRWLRVVLPVAAVAALALAVGLVAVERGGDIRMVDGATTAAESEPAMRGAGTAPTFEEQLDGFAVVVLAEARRATGAFQRFAVVRVLKGDAPGTVKLRVDEEPADRDRLHLLMLRPVAAVDAQAYEGELSGGAATSKGSADGPGRPLAVSYTYEGKPALARELPAGTDPASVTLP